MKGDTIGVFDSGVGGLTVLRAIHRRLPGWRTAYLGDTARVPYGTRSAETVARYARGAAAFLAREERLSMLVVACNTVSAIALDVLAAELPVPVVGVVEPTAARAVALSAKGMIGVIGTQATIASGAYERAVRARNPTAATFARACPLFVPLAEEGWTAPEDPIAAAVAERYLSPLIAEGIDALVLGCTHYPLLEDVIRKVVGPEIALAEASDAVADAIALELGEGRQVRPERRYYVTDVPKGFRAVAERFLGDVLPDVAQVDL